MIEKILKRSLFYFILIFIAIGATNCSVNVDSQLKIIAENANKMCPKPLDEWTRLDSCSVPGEKRYRYYHTLTGVAVEDTTLLKDALTTQIVSIIRVNPDMSFFKDNDVTMEYQYNDESIKYLFKIVVTPENYKR